MPRKAWVLFAVAATFTAYLSCTKLLPAAPADDEVLDGPVDGLSPEQKRRFLAGDAAFNNEVFRRETGLGPLFVAASCGACHAGDGKGHPFTTLTRFGQTDTFGNRFLHLGGPQLQHLSVLGFQPEQLPPGEPFSRFNPPANTGLGLLEAVPDATLLSFADENDADGDGISGRPNWISVPAYCAFRPGTVRRGDGKYIGRFGKKAAVYDLLQQTVNAYNQDMGINSTFEHYSTYDGSDADPEVSNTTVQNVVFYLQALKAPIRRNESDPDAAAGKRLFISLKCGSCHIPEMQTAVSPVSTLSFKTIQPYTDLLLHDMGPALNDGYTEGTALPAEWRTPPLWGLGLSRNSQGGAYFLMHDGRAGSVGQAILLHGGEAQRSRSAYSSLTAAEKSQLIHFLESL